MAERQSLLRCATFTTLIRFAHRHTPVCLSLVVELFPQSSNLSSPQHLQKNAPKRAFFSNWRRGRDSNSGWGRPHDGFQDRCIKPLCHLSSICVTFRIILCLEIENRQRLRLSTPVLPSAICDSKTALIKPLCHLSSICVTFRIILCLEIKNRQRLRLSTPVLPSAICDSKTALIKPLCHLSSICVAFRIILCLEIENRRRLRLSTPVFVPIYCAFIRNFLSRQELF